MSDLFIDLFHYVCILLLGMTLHDLTTLCGNAHVTKLWWANTQGHIFSLLVQYDTVKEDCVNIPELLQSVYIS